MAISDDISPAVRNHMLVVNLTVFLQLVAAGTGVLAHLLWYPGGFLTFCGIFGGLACVLALPQRKEGKKMNVKYVMAVALWMGFAVGPGIRLSVFCYPLSVLATVLIGAALVFGLFVGVTILAKNQHIFYASGLVSIALSFFLWLYYASGSFDPCMNFGGVFTRVIVCLSYYMIDLHGIIKRVERGDLDEAHHSLILTSDLFLVLVPLWVILIKMYYSSVDVPTPALAPSTPGLKESVKERNVLDLMVHISMLTFCGIACLIF